MPNIEVAPFSLGCIILKLLPATSSTTGKHSNSSLKAPEHNLVRKDDDWKAGG